MKNLENFIEDIRNNKSFAQSFKADSAELLTKKATEAGYNFTVEELEAYARSKILLSDEELDQVAGGEGRTAKEWFTQFGKKFLPWIL